MTRTLMGILAAVVILGEADTLRAQNQSLRGAWRVSEVVVTGANASTNSNPQPGLYIFTDRHYSIVTVNSPAPRKPLSPLKVAGKPSQAELMEHYEQWNPFTANSGTYTVKGNIVTTRPLVAKNHAVMTGNDQIREFKIEANTLTLVQKSAAGQPASETRTRLTRAE